MQRVTKRNSNGQYYMDGDGIFSDWGTPEKFMGDDVDTIGAIEDILGDNYDLSRLRELVEADRDGRCVILPTNIYTNEDAKKALENVAPVVHGLPVLRYRPERHEWYETTGLNENGEPLYVKRVRIDEKSWATYCPACGKRLCSRFISFCPNCGAKMDGGESDGKT